jgi:hypothetical protein
VTHRHKANTFRAGLRLARRYDIHLVTLHDFCLLSALFCDAVMHGRHFESQMLIVGLGVYFGKLPVAKWILLFRH